MVIASNLSEKTGIRSSHEGHFVKSGADLTGERKKRTEAACFGYDDLQVRTGGGGTGGGEEASSRSCKKKDRRQEAKDNKIHPFSRASE